MVPFSAVSGISSSSSTATADGIATPALLLLLLPSSLVAKERKKEKYIIIAVGNVESYNEQQRTGMYGPFFFSPKVPCTYIYHFGAVALSDHHRYHYLDLYMARANGTRLSLFSLLLLDPHLLHGYANEASESRGFQFCRKHIWISKQKRSAQKVKERNLFKWTMNGKFDEQKLYFPPQKNSVVRWPHWRVVLRLPFADIRPFYARPFLILTLRAIEAPPSSIKDRMGLRNTVACTWIWDPRDTNHLGGDGRKRFV